MISEGMQRLWDQMMFARVQYDFWKGEQTKSAGFLRIFADEQVEIWSRHVIQLSKFFGEESKDAKGEGEGKSM